MRFIKKYLGILFLTLIIPIAINYFTNFFSWSDIWNKGWIILFILSWLILFPLIIYFLINEKKIKINDQNIFKNLMRILHETDIEYILKDMTNNIPISIKLFNPILDFLAECRKVSNTITNKKLNLLFGNFKKSLNEYSSKRGEYCGPLNNRDEIILGFDQTFKNMNHELYDQRIKELDDIATKAYKDYKILIEFANSKDLEMFSNNINDSEIIKKSESKN